MNIFSLDLSYAIIIIALILVNLIAFTVWGFDKIQAIRQKRRIRESTLLLLVFCGGAFGALCGMVLFRHKTRKTRFRLLVPINILLQASILGWILFHFQNEYKNLWR